MDLRSDLIPPVVALTLSLAAHGAIFRWHPPVPRPDETPPETVELRYLPAPEEGPLTPEQPAAPPPKARPPAPARETRPEPAEAAPKPPVPKTPPREPAPTRSTASPPARAPAPEPPPRGAPTPAPNAPPAQTPAPARSLPDLAQLLPQRADLASVRGDGVPDPVEGDATEATLQLGTQDLRYRGYLGGVRSAVDLSWRWREALLAAGAPGSVVVRFTLVPKGGVEEVSVVQSSGSPILDKEALEAVRRAALPPFPENWTIERLNLVAQFDYRFE